MKHPTHESTSRASDGPITARTVACEALLQHARRFPLLRPIELRVTGLEPRDAALAHALHDGALRRWITIAYLIERVLDRQWNRLEPALQAVLLCGGTQLLFMDRVPAYAAINESVEWTKRVLPRGAGLVNAGLRGLLRLLVGKVENDGRQYVEHWTDRCDCLPLADGRGLVLSRGVLPEEEFDRAIIATSTPRAVLDLFTRAWRQGRALSLHNLVEAPIVMNVEFSTGPVSETLRAHSRPGSAVFEGTQCELRALLRSDPRLFVQDAASSLGVRSVRDLRPRLVLDQCAGQGTKTRQLALTFPEAQIIATDTQEDCLRTLRTLERELANVRVMTLDQVERAWRGKCDFVLADVPCSNTGVLARRLEARYRYGQDQAEADRLTRMQEQIASLAGDMLVPGGTLLYSTCSIETDENTRAPDSLRQRLGFRLVTHDTHLPTGLPGEDASLYSDGSFHARLQKP